MLQSKLKKKFNRESYDHWCNFECQHNSCLIANLMKCFKENLKLLINKSLSEMAIETNLTVCHKTDT